MNLENFRPVLTGDFEGWVLPLGLATNEPKGPFRIVIVVDDKRAGAPRFYCRLAPTGAALVDEFFLSERGATNAAAGMFRKQVGKWVKPEGVA